MQSIAPQVGIAVPESLSISLDETRERTIARDAARQLKAHTVDLDAILIGPGTRAGNDNTAFVTRLLQQCRHVPVILDAGALDALHDEPDALSAHGRNAIITPHWGEISRLLSIDLSEVGARPAVVARQAAESLQAVVVLKGARSFIATPEGDFLSYDAGDVGLATSGSGDTLSGIMAGLLARGARPLHAAAWGVFLHGAAGNALRKRIGRIGYLARELLDEIPPIMNRA